MRRFLNDRCLEHFLAVYQCGNMRDAAQTCSLTQPAISKSIARLEDDLQLLLFTRGSRGLVPLPTAHELFALASQLESTTRRALLRISELNDRARGKLVLGAGEMWSLIRLPKIISQFTADHPNTKIEMQTKNMEHLIRDLAAGEIDFAIGDMADIEVPNTCISCDLAPSLLWPFVRNDHPLTEKNQAELKDLLPYPWLGVLNSRVFEMNVNRHFSDARLPMPNFPVSASSLPAMMEIAGTGDYVTILPIDFQEMAQRFGLVALVTERFQMGALNVSAVFPQEMQTVEPVQYLLDHIQQVWSTHHLDLIS